MNEVSDSPNASFAAIAGMASLHAAAILMVLCSATLMGWIASMDRLLQSGLEDVMDESFAHGLAAGLIWVVTAAIAFGLPTLLLGCRQAWQRLILWIASLVVIGLWAPVLALASHRPEVTMPWSATALAGLFVTLQLYWVARKQTTDS